MYCPHVNVLFKESGSHLTLFSKIMDLKPEILTSIYYLL